MSSEDRWTHPSAADDSGDIDREMTDPEAVAAKQEERTGSHPQERVRAQGTSADSPGVDPSDRESEGGGTPSAD